MQTKAVGGINLKHFNVAGRIYSLQVRDRDGEWRHWETVGTKGLNVGRAAKSAPVELNSMGSRHMHVRLNGGEILVEDLGSLNGVFLKLTRPMELVDEARFRIGSQIVAFHRAPAVEPVSPRVAEDGEELWSAEAEPLAYLDFIRPNGEPGMRFPITTNQTILGRLNRPGRPVDVALPKDEVVSGQHAQIRFEDGKFWLEDLGSRNGTFLQIKGSNVIQPGEVLLVGQVQFRVNIQAIAG